MTARLLDRNLGLRVASAVVLLPLVGGLVWWRDSRGLAALTLLAAIGAQREHTALCVPSLAVRRVALLFGALTFAAAYLRPGLVHPALMISVVAIGAAALRDAREPGAAVASFGGAVLGLVHVPLLLVTLPLLHRDFPFGRLWVIVAVAVTFVSDTAAYFVGKPFGRHKLAPLVSPGKSIEGGVGGLLGALAFMLLARATFFPSLTPLDVAVGSAAGGVVGPIGDLVESLLKRAAGAKDSGSLIPGHGGVLDRVDAMLFVSAVLYVHVAWVR
jgi:phosphatidate cytidylyltransferase